MLDPETGEVPANGHVHTLPPGIHLYGMIDLPVTQRDPTPAEFAAWEATGRKYPPPWVTEKHAGRFEQPPPGGPTT